MYVSFKRGCEWFLIGDSCGDVIGVCVCEVGLLILKCPIKGLSVCLSPVVVVVMGVLDLVGVWLVVVVVRESSSR